MQSGDWIQVCLAALTFLGLITVWIQPKAAQRSASKSNCDRMKKCISLYLDVFEVKMERELFLKNKGRGCSFEKGEFEGNNQINYHALEDILRNGNDLDTDSWDELMEFVRDFKVSPNMHGEADALAFLSRVRNVKLRKEFAPGRSLSKAILEAKS